MIGLHTSPIEQSMEVDRSNENLLGYFQASEFDSFIFETSNTISSNRVVQESMKDQYTQENIDEKFPSKSMADHTMQCLLACLDGSSYEHEVDYGDEYASQSTDSIIGLNIPPIEHSLEGERSNENLSKDVSNAKFDSFIFGTTIDISSNDVIQKSMKDQHTQENIEVDHEFFCLIITLKWMKSLFSRRHSKILRKMRLMSKEIILPPKPFHAHNLN